MDKYQILAGGEQMARQLLQLPADVQDEFFASLPALGFTPEEVETVKGFVGYFHLLTDNRHYQQMKQALGLQLWEEFNAK